MCRRQFTTMSSDAACRVSSGQAGDDEFKNRPPWSFAAVRSACRRPSELVTEIGVRREMSSASCCSASVFSRTSSGTAARAIPADQHGQTPRSINDASGFPRDGQAGFSRAGARASAELLQLPAAACAEVRENQATSQVCAAFALS